MSAVSPNSKGGLVGGIGGDDGMLPAVQEDCYSLSVLLREDMVEESCFAGAKISWSVSKMASALKLFSNLSQR